VLCSPYCKFGSRPFLRAAQLVFARGPARLPQRSTRLGLWPSSSASRARASYPCSLLAERPAQLTWPAAARRRACLRAAAAGGPTRGGPPGPPRSEPSISIGRLSVDFAAVKTATAGSPATLARPSLLPFSELESGGAAGVLWPPRRPFRPPHHGLAVVEVAQPRALLSFSPPLLSLAFAPNRGGHGWLGKEMAAPPWRPSPVHACGRSRARRRRAAPRWCPLGAHTSAPPASRRRAAARLCDAPRRAAARGCPAQRR